MEPQPLNARVVLRQDLNDRLAVVRVAPEGWELSSFEPGQATTLGLPDPERPGKLLQRVYSIASAPRADWMEFYLQLVKEGALTTRLWHLHAGDALWLSPRITGTFTLDRVPAGQDLLLVATGTGLAPYMAMLRHFRGRGRWRRCVIVHGARSAQELGYRAELEQLAREDPSIVYVPTLTRESEGGGWSGQRGRVQNAIEPQVFERLVGTPLDAATWHAYLCGNPAMVDDMERLLVARGFVVHSRAQPGNIHFERYW